MEAINRNPISGVAGLFTSRVCDRTDRSIEMFAVGAEGKSNEITLVSVYRQATFRKIGELVGAQIENCNGLVRLVLLCAVSIVQNRRIASIGTHCHRCREAVEGTVKGLLVGSGICRGSLGFCAPRKVTMAAKDRNAIEYRILRKWSLLGDELVAYHSEKETGQAS
jgi:hypothetical protein